VTREAALPRRAATISQSDELVLAKNFFEAHPPQIGNQPLPKLLTFLSRRARVHSRHDDRTEAKISAAEWDGDEPEKF